MKKTDMSFAEGFLGIQANKAKQQGKPMLAFDWNKAAEIIKTQLIDYPDLVAEAGLQNDWDHTSGIIFINGKPTNDSYTYLASNWAKPTLILSWDNKEQQEIECSCEQDEKNHSDTKWSQESLNILGISELIELD